MTRTYRSANGPSGATSSGGVPPEVRQAFGRFLQARRQQLSLGPQRDMPSWAGISPAMLSDYESGKRWPAKPSTRRDLELLYGLPDGSLEGIERAPNVATAQKVMDDLAKLPGPPDYVDKLVLRHGDRLVDELERLYAPAQMRASDPLLARKLLKIVKEWRSRLAEPSH